MKYLLILPLFFLYHIALAQVPPRSEASGDIRGDIDVPITAEAMTPANRVTSYYQKDGKYGFIDPQGVRQAAIYNKIDFTSNGFIIQKGELYGIADKKGQVIGNIDYDSVGTAYKTAYIVKKKGKYGTIMNDGNKILSIKYDKILSANSFVSFVRSAKGQIQMIFNEQEKAFPSQIEYAALYANLVIIKANGKFGVVKNQLVVSLNYDSIYVSSAQINTIITQAKQPVKKYSLIDKSNSFRAVTLLTLQNGNKYGLADSDGALIYPVDNDAVYNQENYRYYTVKKGNLYGIYFVNGKKKTGIEFEKVYADGVGYVMATKNRKAGVFDLQGNQIVAFDYDPEFIMQYRIGFRVTKNKKRGIVGKKGEILVPAKYDDVDPFYETGLGEFVKVKSDGKFGIVNLEGKTIIPVEFGWIGEEKGLLKVLTADKRVGLYDKTGKVVIPADYRWITDSDTENSNIIVLKKQDNTYNFLNKKTLQVVLTENVSNYGHIPNQDGLLNPFSSSGKPLSFVKGKNGKIGLLNEITGLLDVPMTYDDIMQHFDMGKHVYFSVRKGKKHGLIDEKNKAVIPLEYDAISIDLMSADAYSVIVAKGRKFGTINLENKMQIPFQYDDLQRISQNGLYKAKVGAGYRVISSKNKIINKGPFDEVANFEGTDGSGYQALTFYKGRMRVIDEKGRFITTEVAMQPHRGYKTFDELKWALVEALDSKNESLLKDFAANIAPSEHLLFYLKENVFTKQALQYTNVNAVREKYYNDLFKFKLSRWNQNSDFAYNRALLTEVQDYTLYQQGFVTNARRTDPAFGDTRFMEKVLRNAIKINGYWISTYFMQRYFDRFEP
jgi:hypothetical protein